MTVSFRIVIWVGGLALLAATAIDTVAVLGRHAGFPITGSLEMMQTATLVAGVIATLVATIDNAHARVRLVISRLSPPKRVIADRISDLLTLLFFVAMLIGSSWIAWDLRDAYERSEVLGIPWMALRIFAGLTMLATCVTLGRRVIFGGRPHHSVTTNPAMHDE